MIAGSPVPIRPAGRTFVHPYVVRTPPYAQQSAGIRVLHWLCDALNRLGARAFVDVDLARGAPGADPAAGVAAGLDAPPMTPELRAELQAPGAAAPIVIHPDAFDDIEPAGERAPTRLNVRYALNYLGVMGAPDPAPCDLVVAYSEAIRRKTPGCGDVLFIPGSDPRWWTPPAPSANPGTRRRQALVYAGKYVDHHRQRLPLHLRDAHAITRHQPDSPTTEALRELLRRGTRLYVFENTSVAAEAALCGCPVVVCRNWFFPELIAEHELGTDGFAFADDPASLDAAQASLPAFRPRYEAAMDAVQPALLRFVEKTQGMSERLSEGAVRAAMSERTS